MYILLSLIGMIGCLLALKLREDYKINLILGCLSTLFSVYLVEILLFVFNRDTINPAHLFEKRKEFARAQGFLFDDRPASQVIADLKKQGIEAYPAVFPYLFVEVNKTIPDTLPILPLSGISKTTTVFCNEYGKYVIYESDEHGFNNPYGGFAQKAIDIILIGDSFAQGHCVEPGRDIGGQLRKTWNNVISLGMNGSGPLLEFAIFREFAEPMKPKIVLWMYYEGNDLRELEKEKNESILLKYLDDNFSQGLMNKQAEVDQFLIGYVTQKTRAGKNHSQKQQNNTWILLVKVWHLRNKLGLAPSPLSPVPPPLFTTILKKARDITLSWGGKLYFVYLPDRERYVRDVDHENFMSRDQVLSIAQQLNIPVIDIHEAFRNSPDPLSLFPFKLPGHYTPEGYRIVAQHIAKSLRALKTENSTLQVIRKDLLR
jgi:hypothetical protein